MSVCVNHDLLRVLEQIALYWAEGERPLDKVLKFKYRTNLDEEGLGTDNELYISVDALKSEMSALHAKMSSEVLPS